MFREGTRVVVVDERKARSVCALVRNGQKGTTGKCYGDSTTVHMDGDTSETPWTMSASCLRRIPKPKK